jgi:hypothetical protein
VNNVARGIGKFVNKNITGNFLPVPFLFGLFLNAVFAVPNRKNFYCAGYGKYCKKMILQGLTAPQYAV